MLKIKSTADKFKGYDRGPPLKSKEFLYGWFPPMIDVYQRCLEKQTSYELQCLYNHSNSRYIDHHKGTKTPVAPAHIQFRKTPTQENLSTKTCYDSESSRRFVESVNDLIERTEQRSLSRPESRISVADSVSSSINTDSSKSTIQLSGKSSRLSRPKTALSFKSGSPAAESKRVLRPKSVPATAMSTSRSMSMLSAATGSMSLSSDKSVSVRSVVNQKSRCSPYPHKTWSTDGYETEVQIVMSPPMSPKTIKNSTDKVTDYLSKISENSDTLESNDSINQNEQKNKSRQRSGKPVSKTPKPVHTGSNSRSESAIAKPNGSKDTGVDKKQSNLDQPLKSQPNSLKSPSMSDLNRSASVTKSNSSNFKSTFKGEDHSKSPIKSSANNLKSPSTSSLHSASMTLLMMSPIPVDDFSVFSSMKKSNTPTVRSLLLEKPTENDMGQIRKQSFKPPVNQYTSYKPMYNDKLQDMQWRMAKK